MIHRLEFRAMGCQMLAVIDSQGPKAPAILEQVPAWFEEWEQCLSRFRGDSELCQLNSRSGELVQVSETLWEVFQAAKQAEKLTGGLVSPLILDALMHAGYDRTFERLFESTPHFLPEAGPTQDTLDAVEADETSSTIRLPHGVRLDFGGVAKGWAARKAMERLAEAGPALVDAGGDISISGPRLDGEGWRIGIVNPFLPDEDLNVLSLKGGGVATSGKDYRRWMRGDVLQHHIIDPRTGLPAETDILTATVSAETVLQAEAFAKAAMISGSQAGLAFLESQPQACGLFVLETGPVVLSRNIRQYLQMNEQGMI